MRASAHFRGVCSNGLFLFPEKVVERGITGLLFAGHIYLSFLFHARTNAIVMVAVTAVFYSLSSDNGTKRESRLCFRAQMIAPERRGIVSCHVKLTEQKISGSSRLDPNERQGQLE